MVRIIRQRHGLGLIDRKVAVQAVCATIHNSTSGLSLLSDDSKAEDVLTPQNVLHKPVAVIKRKSLSLAQMQDTQDTKVVMRKDGGVWVKAHTHYTHYTQYGSWVPITDKDQYQ